MAGQQLGFIGVGRMGFHMVDRLLKAGHQVTIYDVDKPAVSRLEGMGAKGAASAAAVASAAETVLVSLPTPDIVRETALGEKGVIGGTKVKTFIDLSTTGPLMAVEVAAVLEKKGIVAVDAPVSGGPKGAEKGTLAIMVSGPNKLADNLRPILEVLGKVFWVGEKAGMGQTMKVINNVMSATSFAITSEAFVMGAKAGLDAETMLAVVNSSSGKNNATEDKFPRYVLPRTFDFGFALDLMLKDVTLGLRYAEALGVPMMVGNATRQLLSITKSREGGHVDLTRTVCTVEEWAGVQVKGKA